jgi:hypothetical protein
MTTRVVAALGVGLAVLLVCAGGAGAQPYPPAYPPAPNTITVDDPTPDPGQVVTVTLSTCRPGTIALLGIDLWLLGAPVVDADGVARAQVTVPASIRPGRHVVSGACITPSGRPLFLTTRITVPGRGGAAGGGGGGGAQAGTGGGGAGQPSLGALAGPAVPPDAARIYQTTALANRITDSGSGDGGCGRAAGRPRRLGRCRRRDRDAGSDRPGGIGAPRHRGRARGAGDQPPALRRGPQRVRSA